MKVLFAGTPAFAASHLQALLDADVDIRGVISQPDKPGKRGRQPVPGPVSKLATASGLTLTQPARLMAADLQPFGADVLIVVAYGQILKPAVLEALPLGCINVHASLLPRWRGAAPIQRAILEGDERTGVCIMKMDAGLDTGDVYTRREVAIDPTDSTATLSSKLAAEGAAALIETLAALDKGTASLTAQPEDGVTYAKKVNKEEARIDWTWSAGRIDRCIRAFDPDPVAFAFLGDLRVKLWQASPLAADRGEPGEILDASSKGIIVRCGEGALAIGRLQLPVGKGTVVSAADVVNARAADFAPGNRFS